MPSSNSIEAESRELVSKIKSQNASLEEKRFAEKYDDIKLTEKCTTGIFLIGSVFCVVAIVELAECVSHEEPVIDMSVLAALIYTLCYFIGLFTVPYNFQEKKRRLMEEVKTLYNTQAGVIICIDHEEALSVPTTSRALDETRNVGPANQSLFENKKNPPSSSARIEDETTTFPPSSAKLIAPQINNPINKTPVSLA